MKFFKPEEFDCKCGCGLGMANMNAELLALIDRYRELSGFPWAVWSAIRCEKHNHEWGGGYASLHLCGKAVDIKCNPFEKYDIISIVTAEKKLTVGVYRNFLHLDIRSGKPIIFWGKY